MLDYHPGLKATPPENRRGNKEKNGCTFGMVTAVSVLSTGLIICVVKSD